MKRHFTYATLLLLSLARCQTPPTEQTPPDVTTMATDHHTYARPEEAVVRHLNLDVAVDFDQRQIAGTASYDVENLAGVDQMYFDTKGLEIESVTLDSTRTATEFKTSPNEKYLGSALRVDVKPTTRQVHIRYRTRPDAAALQWLRPAQTAGDAPFLFTQGQAILTRSWVPTQDSPGIRFTYEATVRVPDTLLAVMSAVNPTRLDSSGVYRFEMPQPVPAYLMALAVGELAFAEVGPRTGVYAEPATLEAARYEFAEMEKMLTAAERLYGPYRWERYDLIVLPPSFPFGGMENPRLTFATPTILAGDRSLTSLVAHELAHSWSGNLATNQTWDDFWLNEGFTVYFERRIMEELYGADYADMLAQLGAQDLRRTLEALGERSEDTQLKLTLKDRDPDEGMTDVAYEKGYFFLRAVEEAVGRQRFDAFLRQYFDDHAFQTISTEQFLIYLRENLLDSETYDSLRLEDWVYQPGVPNATALDVSSARFDRVGEQITRWESGTPAAELDTAGWSSHEWLYFIRRLPDPLGADRMAALDSTFGFTESNNSEIQAAWYERALQNGYAQAYPQVRAFLSTVGRRKFLVPLYEAMQNKPALQPMAQEIYAAARPSYHYVATNTLDEMLEYRTK